MRWMLYVWVAVALGWTAGHAQDANDLLGGVFIVHAPAALVFSDAPPEEGWCQHYLDNFAISDSASQRVRVDGGSGGVGVIWFVLAAWTTEKEFCGFEFGLEGYNQNAFEFGNDYDPCPPVGGSFLETPSSGWPGPNEGTVVSRTGAVNWSGNYIPIYYFSGYAYEEETVIRLGVNPGTELERGVFGSCDTPPVTASATCFGALGVNTDGVACAPAPPPPQYACCDEGVCFIAVQEDCVNAGGEWQVGTESCDPDPCPAYGACCISGSCFHIEEPDCDFMGGTWYEDYTCEYDCGQLAELGVCCLERVCYLIWEADCSALAAQLPGYYVQWRPEWISCAEGHCLDLRVCCFDEECTLLLEDECDAQGGIWVPDGTTCEEGEHPCPAPAVVPTTWGHIKAIYR